MSIYNIDIDELRLLLRFDGVNLDEYDNEELEILIKSKQDELEGYTGADIHPRDRTDIRQEFTNTSYNLHHYPILSVHNVYLNDHPVNRYDYNVSYNTGVIYFNKDILGTPVHYYPRRFGRGYQRSHGNVLKVEYTTGVDEIFYKNHILPLIREMVGYTVSFGTLNQRTGGLSLITNSLHEGDLSMNLGSGNGSGNSNYGYSISINNKIDELSRMFHYNSRVAII